MLTELVYPTRHAIRSMTSKGLCMLSDVGGWTKNTNGKLMFSTTVSPAPQAKWTPKAREHWNKLMTVLNNMDAKWLFDGDPTLMMTRTQRQSEAEEYVRGLPAILSLRPSRLPPPKPSVGIGWLNDSCNEWNWK